MAEIDPEWMRRELDAIIADVQQHFPSQPADIVARTVNEAATSLVVHASVPNYLPVLIRRRVTSVLGNGAVADIA